MTQRGGAAYAAPPRGAPRLLCSISLVKHEEHCDELDREVDRFADALAHADFAAPVPSCPEWSVRDLTEHLGRVHRWARELVRTRATERMPMPPWMWERARSTSSGFVRAVIRSLRPCVPQIPMSPCGRGAQISTFASGRGANCMKRWCTGSTSSSAMGEASIVDSAVALDAVDEFLDNVKSDRDIAVRARPTRSDGESLEFRTADSSKSWAVELSADGYAFVDAL